LKTLGWGLGLVGGTRYAIYEIGEVIQVKIDLFWQLGNI